VSGFIDGVHFKDGQMVKAGDLLFTIDPRPFRIAVDSAKAEIARTSAQVELAENEVDRATPLAKTRVLTEREFDKRKSDLSVARAGMLASEASLKSAELNLEWTEVRAPISGRISNRKIDIGNVVSSGQNGTTLRDDRVDDRCTSCSTSRSDFLRYARLFSPHRGQSVRLRPTDPTGAARQMDFVDNQLNSRSGTCAPAPFSTTG
jgi:RND family efflux transporter MFP subunit